MCFSSNKQSYSHRDRKSTILIEQEDSLLIESTIKDFLQTQSYNKKFNEIQSILSTPINSESAFKSTDNTKKFFGKPSSPHIIKKISDSFKLASIPHMVFINHKNQFQNSNIFSINAQTHVTTTKTRPLSFVKNQSSHLTKKQFLSHIQNKKLWTQNMLKKAAQQKKKLAIKEGQSFKINQSQNRFFRQKLTKNIKGQILKSVENSTWLKLNPETLKQSLIILSKMQKQERKSFFAMKQASINQQNGLKSMNKLLILRQPKSAKTLLNKSKSKFDESLILKKNLTSRKLVSQSFYEKKMKTVNLLEKKGLLGNPFKTTVGKHEILRDAESEFLYI